MTRKTIGILGGVVVVAMFAALTVAFQHPRAAPPAGPQVQEELTRDVAFEETVIVGRPSMQEQRSVEFEPTVISIPARHARIAPKHAAASIE